MGLGHSPRIVTNGLVLCLDAANPRSYPGSGTTWSDLSLSKYTATLTNGPTYSSANNGSIVFDGVNDYISVPNGNYINSNDFTIGIWAYIPTIGTTFTQYTLVHKNVYNTSGLSFAAGTGGALTNRICGMRFSTSGNLGGAYNFTPTFTFDQWHYFVLSFSYDGSSLTTISHYLDGVFVNSFTSSGTFVTNTTSLGIGNSAPGNGSYLNGNVSLYTIFNRALSAAEINQNFQSHRGRYGI